RPFCERGAARAVESALLVLRQSRSKHVTAEPADQIFLADPGEQLLRSRIELGLPPGRADEVAHGRLRQVRALSARTVDHGGQYLDRLCIVARVRHHPTALERNLRETARLLDHPDRLAEVLNRGESVDTELD